MFPFESSPGAAGAWGNRRLSLPGPLPESDQSKNRRRVTSAGGTAGRCPEASMLASEAKKVSPRDEALPASPWSWRAPRSNQPRSHDNLHEALRAPLALARSVPTDVHSRSSIATSDPVTFSAPSANSANPLQFSVKGAVSE